MLSEENQFSWIYVEFKEIILQKPLRMNTQNEIDLCTNENI